jgi:hypothetical protein
VLGFSIQWNWVIALLAVGLQSESTFATNKLQLRKNGNEVAIDFSNADPVAGFQFTVNGRGGIALRSYSAGDRAASAGIAVYQYLKDDSTLNVIMIAPFRSALPAGEGVLGEISFVLNQSLSADTVRVFLSQVVICSAEAAYLEVSSTQLAWNAGANLNVDHALFVLEQNFPNPFNPSTTITYILEESAMVKLVVFDVSGKEVNILVDQQQPAGRHAMKWNVPGNGGSRLASGVYFARLQVGDKVALRKMIFMK